ncbi:MAG TPA: phage tail tape measure protein, partial [Gammaproteobacteria bacterium]|nr:phage tail tape measure protein [Gammaproteobacteria bacterium]
VVNPLVFAGAPRLHRGGLASDEVPTILQRGEEVLTRSDPRHVLNAGMAGGNRTEINVSGTSDPALVITAAVQAADIIERRQARRRR